MQIPRAERFGWLTLELAAGIDRSNVMALSEGSSPGHPDLVLWSESLPRRIPAAVGRHVVGLLPRDRLSLAFQWRREVEVEPDGETTVRIGAR